MTQPYWTLAYLTDYGNQDAYSGILKGVALGILTPAARQQVTFVDITHGVPAGDIRQGAWQLAQAVPCFPAHTVFVAVVDPGVGHPQQGHVLAIRPDYQQVFIAPDNGLLSRVLERYQCLLWRIDSPALYWSPPGQSAVGATFAGRDIYSPVAAQLLNALVAGEGNDFLARHGQPTTQVNRLEWPQPVHQAEGSWLGQIVVEDGFGNGITNLPIDCFDQATQQVQLQWQGWVCQVPLARHYQPTQQDKTDILQLVAGSHGYWELACYHRPYKALVPPEVDRARVFQLLPL